MAVSRPGDDVRLLTGNEAGSSPAPSARLGEPTVVLPSPKRIAVGASPTTHAKEEVEVTYGIGAMLHYLGGGSDEDPAKFYGRTIKSVEMTEEVFRLKFEDGTGAEIEDHGQSCCEHRYMTCDDDIQSLVGQKLTRIEAKDGPMVNEGWGEHEQVFVEVGTDQGFVTIANHNEHNGYYGGFGLNVKEISAD